jgi:hypothetical protein
MFYLLYFPSCASGHATRMTRIGRIYTDNRIRAYPCNPCNPCAIGTVDEYRRDIYSNFNIFKWRADLFPRQPTGIKPQASKSRCGVSRVRISRMFLIRVFSGEKGQKSDRRCGVICTRAHHAEFFSAFEVKSATGNMDDTDRKDFHG